MIANLVKNSRFFSSLQSGTKNSRNKSSFSHLWLRHHNYELCPGDYKLNQISASCTDPCTDISLVSLFEDQLQHMHLFEIVLSLSSANFSPSYLKWVTQSKCISNPLRTSAPNKYKQSIELGENSIQLRDKANPTIRAEKQENHGYCHQKKPRRTPEWVDGGDSTLVEPLSGLPHVGHICFAQSSTPRGGNGDPTPLQTHKIN